MESVTRQPFIPKWAENALAPKLTAHERAELQVLREFYTAFEAMHATPDDKFHKAKKDGFARIVLEKAYLLRAMNNPQLGNLTLNGVKVG